MTTTALIVLTVVFAAITAAAGLILRTSSDELETNTAPSLLAVQNVRASMAEADASATAVYLAGSGTTGARVQQNLYLDAVQRTSSQVEDVARFVGDDNEAHDALKTISSGLVTYNGHIEASRASPAGDDTELLAALRLSRTSVAPAADVVTGRAQTQLKAEHGRAANLIRLSWLFGIPALAVAVWLQYGTFRRTNRMINPGLFLAGLALAGLLIYSFVATSTRSSALTNATEGGYQAIDRTASVQSLVYELQSGVGLDVLGSALERNQAETMADIETRLGVIVEAADSPREEAAAAEAMARWARYRASTESILQLSSQTADRDAAVTQFESTGISTFNGMNTSLESVLSDNRIQFDDGVSQAASAVRWLPVAAVVLALVAVIGATLGIQARLEEYR
ncbi:MAG: hypothetical protein ACK5PP_14870 [Acidimicrobiales bacterium]